MRNLSAWELEGLPPKVARAKLHYVPTTKKKAAIALECEERVAKIFGVERCPDNAPYDVVARKIGIEVKSLIEGKQDCVYIRKDAKLAKIAMLRTHEVSSCFTVVIDLRGDEEKIYLKPGIGSYRLKSMIRMPNLDALPFYIHHYLTLKEAKKLWQSLLKDFHELPCPF